MFQSKEKSLHAVLDEIWIMMARGAARYNDPLHTPVLGTVAKTGCSLRTVILREADKKSRTLICYTDARALKAIEIESSENISWLFFHPKLQIQLRMSGPAKLHHSDAIADKRWARVSPISRLNYLAKLRPGTPVEAPTSGLPDFFQNRVPALVESQKGRQNFMVIVGRIQTIDWLKLKKLGNLRARFDWEDDRWRSTWLVP